MPVSAVLGQSKLSELLPLSLHSLFRHPYNPVSALALVLALFCVKWARKRTLGKGKG